MGCQGFRPGIAIYAPFSGPEGGKTKRLTLVSNILKVRLNWLCQFHLLLSNATSYLCFKITLYNVWHSCLPMGIALGRRWVTLRLRAPKPPNAAPQPGLSPAQPPTRSRSVNHPQPLRPRRWRPYEEGFKPAKRQQLPLRAQARASDGVAGRSPGTGVLSGLSRFYF